MHFCCGGASETPQTEAKARATTPSHALRSNTTHPPTSNTSPAYDPADYPTTLDAPAISVPCSALRARIGHLSHQQASAHRLVSHSIIK